MLRHRGTDAGLSGHPPRLSPPEAKPNRRPEGCRLPVPELDSQTGSSTELTQVWDAIRTQLRTEVTEVTFHIWREPLEPAAHNGGVLYVRAPEHVRTWVEERFQPLLSGAALRAANIPRGEVVAHDWEPPQHAVAPPEATAGGLNPRYTFDQFVIGDGNRLAHAAALAVAEMPGLAYNPLFICGPPGLGKTHLLHSIANYVRDHGGGMSVLYTTAEAFTDQFVGALQSGAIGGFKAAYRNVDVLLVDDVQFLVGKARTEQEFFHTFNALHQAGSQLVLTSDRLPRDMEALEDRLRERFEAGLVCDVRPADRATRLTILRKRVAQDDVGQVDPAALELIADRVDTNLRALEGALIRVVAFGSLTARAVTAELAGEVLAGLYPELKPRRTTMRDVQECTCEVFGVSFEELVSSSRAQSVAWPR